MAPSGKDLFPPGEYLLPPPPTRPDPSTWLKRQKESKGGAQAANASQFGAEADERPKSSSKAEPSTFIGSEQISRLASTRPAPSTGWNYDRHRKVETFGAPLPNVSPFPTSGTSAFGQVGLQPSNAPKPAGEPTNTLKPGSTNVLRDMDLSHDVFNKAIKSLSDTLGAFANGRQDINRMLMGWRETLQAAAAKQQRHEKETVRLQNQLASTKNQLQTMELRSVKTSDELKKARPTIDSLESQLAAKDGLHQKELDSLRSESRVAADLHEQAVCERDAASVCATVSANDAERMRLRLDEAEDVVGIALKDKEAAEETLAAVQVIIDDLRAENNALKAFIASQAPPAEDADTVGLSGNV